MKRFLVAFVLGLAFAPSAFAQDQGQGGGGGGQGQGQGQGGQGQDQGRGNRGNRQRGRGNNNFGRNYADQLKDRLGLSEEQLAKVKGMEEQVRKDMESLFSEMRNGGGDRNALREKIQQGTEKMRSDIKGLLTEEQTKKFDEWVKEQESRRGGRRGQDGQQNGGRGRDPAERAKRELDEAQKALTLSPEEKSAVLPLIQKLLETRATNRNNEDKRRTELNAFLKGKGATDEEKSAIAAKLKEYRDAKHGDEDKLKAAQEAVREVLTVENEAKLCGMGILP